jgi:membrane fusion protein, multidrug efflux system
MKRILTFSLLALAIVGIVVVLLGNKNKLDERKVPVDRSIIPVSVATYEVKAVAMEKSFEAPATLAAQEDAIAAAEIAGRIERLSFSLGSRVQKGQTIGRIDVREKEIKLEAAQLAIDHLGREYERNKILAEGNAINTKTLQDSKYEYDSKVLEAAELKAQISDANIRAPIGGMITEKKKSPESLCRPAAQ